MKLDITVGKYTLESLTNGMYASPLDLYREYIQNAVDSFDEAAAKGIGKEKDFQIEIMLDSVVQSIFIRDNGCGIEKEKAVKTLLDIGNSKKKRLVSRGFRGIGRLAGLGYCSKLSFVTSAVGESIKTIIVFDANELKQLLLSVDEESVSVQDVLEKIVKIKYVPEKASAHYFEVILENVDMAGKLLNKELVEDYLVQHSPLPFGMDFRWSSLILSKLEMLGCNVKDYKLILEVDGARKELFKPYQNTFVADRVRKTEDTLKDIVIVPFYRNEKLCAVLWYGQTEFFGTILDSSIKGIRIRQGNILIGGRSTCNQFFKEERFNGWAVGELHILDPELIINSRRDDFEKNAAYYEFVELVSEWSWNLSKEIRKKSYDRSLSNEKKAVIEADVFDDINGLGTEAIEFSDEYGEAELMDAGDSQFLAENDYFDKLSLILNQKKAQTKYSALNINSKLTIEQRKVLERVFDIISQEYDKALAEKFTATISRKF